jgi:hypothetical protein
VHPVARRQAPVQHGFETEGQAVHPPACLPAAAGCQPQACQQQQHMALEVAPVPAAAAAAAAAVGCRGRSLLPGLGQVKACLKALMTAAVAAAAGGSTSSSTAPWVAWLLAAVCTDGWNVMGCLHALLGCRTLVHPAAGTAAHASTAKQATISCLQSLLKKCGKLCIWRAADPAELSWSPGAKT